MRRSKAGKHWASEWPLSSVFAPNRGASNEAWGRRQTYLLRWKPVTMPGWGLRVGEYPDAAEERPNK
jgi:hypothetical protein